MRESPATSTCLPPDFGLRISLRSRYSENPAVEAGSMMELYKPLWKIRPSTAVKKIAVKRMRGRTRNLRCWEDTSPPFA